MLEDLNMPKNFDLKIYAMGKLARDVEAAFSKYFNNQPVYYYFESCRQHRPIRPATDLVIMKTSEAEVCACKNHRLIWCGRGLSHFIRTAQRYVSKYMDAPVLFVTNQPVKGHIEYARLVYDRLWIAEDFAYQAMRNYAVYEGSYSIAHYQDLHAAYRKIYDQAEQARITMSKMEYWIGDAASDGPMIACDPMFGYLWDLMRGAV